MNLYYIHLGLDYDTYSSLDNDIRFYFQKRTNFIDDYFSKAIRKIKFKTDGTFNMISVSVNEYEISPTSIVPFDVLNVNLPFNRVEYEELNEIDECHYYLKLLEQGFLKASEFKTIPLESLLNLINEFKSNHFRNEWLHKSKRFKKDDLEIILKCLFTINHFQLIITINQISTKLELVKGIIISTETGVSIHEGMYKDIIVTDKDIIITDKTDSPRIIIIKDDVFTRKLNFTITGDEEIKKILSFDYK